MSTLWKINKKKIVFVALANTFYSGIFILAIVLLSYFINGRINNYEFGFIIAPIPILVGISTIVSTLLGTKKTDRLKAKYLNNPPLNQLNSIGFIDDITHKKNRWKLSEQTKSFILSDYEINLEFIRDNEKNDFDKIIFTTRCKKKKLGLVKNTQLKDRLGKHDINFNGKKVFKYYYPHFIPNMTIDEIEQDLHEFMALLKLEGFDPDYNN